MCYDKLYLNGELKFMLTKFIEEEKSIVQSEVLCKKFVSS